MQHWRGCLIWNVLMIRDINECTDALPRFKTHFDPKLADFTCYIAFYTYCIARILRILFHGKVTSIESCNVETVMFVWHGPTEIAMCLYIHTQIRGSKLPPLRNECHNNNQDLMNEHYSSSLPSLWYGLKSDLSSYMSVNQDSNSQPVPNQFLENWKLIVTNHEMSLDGWDPSTVIS